MKAALILGALLVGIATAQDLPKAVEGENGWLFTNEELQRFPGTQNVYNEQLGAIAQVVQLFKEQGIKVAVIVVPTKASIYPELLPNGLKASLDYSGNYAKVMAGLTQLGVRTVNLKAPLTARKSEGLLYLKTDTHWTPLGMQVAAEAVNKTLNADLNKLSVTAFTAERLPAMDVRMDLVSQLPEARRAAYSGETTTGLTITSASDDLLGDAPAPQMTLLGTSYSTAFDGRGLTPPYEKIFSKAISLATKRDILSYAVGAKGFWQPVADYAQSPEYRTQPPKLVLWEIPERYLSFEAPSQWAIPSFPWLESKLSRGKNDCLRNFTTCNKTTSTMKYVLDWANVDVVTGTGIYRTTAEGFFGREGTIRHAGPDHSKVSFWLRTSQAITLKLAMVAPIPGQQVRVLLNGKVVKSFALVKDAPYEDRVVLSGRAGLNQLSFRYTNWNTKTTTFANGDARKIAVTFSKLSLQK